MRGANFNVHGGACREDMHVVQESMLPALPSPRSYNPLDEPSPLGLTLKKTPSLVELISRMVANSDTHDKGRSSTAAVDKMKASNFPASMLRIGNWERISRYEGDLVAKCYYAKRKLVWEVLENGLKSKMEIQWVDITALYASYSDNEPGTLIVEVSRPPLFFAENDPQPRKHTAWQATSDFTGGQAIVCKRQILHFPPGVLNKHYERLVSYDERLKNLSQFVVASGFISSGVYGLYDQSFSSIRMTPSHAATLPSNAASPLPVIDLHGIEESGSSSDELDDTRWDHVNSSNRRILHQISEVLFQESSLSRASHEANDIQQTVWVPDCQGDHAMLEQSGFWSAPASMSNDSQEISRNWSTADVFGDMASEPADNMFVSRNCSAGDLLGNLPRIASLPHFFMGQDEIAYS